MKILTVLLFLLITYGCSTPPQELEQINKNRQEFCKIYDKIFDECFNKTSLNNYESKNTECRDYTFYKIGGHPKNDDGFWAYFDCKWYR